MGGIGILNKREKRALDGRGMSRCGGNPGGNDGGFFSIRHSHDDSTSLIICSTTELVARANCLVSVS